MDRFSLLCSSVSCVVIGKRATRFTLFTHFVVARRFAPSTATRERAPVSLPLVAVRGTRTRRCEERSDEAISSGEIASSSLTGLLATTENQLKSVPCP